MCYVQPIAEKSLYCVCWIFQLLLIRSIMMFQSIAFDSLLAYGDWLSHGSNIFCEIGHSQSVLLDSCRRVQFAKQYKRMKLDKDADSKSAHRKSQAVQKEQTTD